MSLHVYVLTPEKHQIVETYHTLWGASRVVVRNQHDWYDARARCIQHAITNEFDKIVVVAGTVELYHRPHWNGLGEESVAARMSDNGQHGMWLYLNRLLNRYSHVYVPPLSACLSWKAMRTRPWPYINNPVIPMVAGYRVDALTQMTDHTLPIGQRMCGMGYDSLTVNDYFFHNHGPTHYDEAGTVTSWSKSYERAISRIC